VKKTIFILSLIGAIIIASVLYFKSKRQQPPQTAPTGGMQTVNTFIEVAGRVLMMGHGQLSSLELMGIMTQLGLPIPAPGPTQEQDMRTAINAHCMAQPDVNAPSGITLPGGGPAPAPTTPTLATTTSPLRRGRQRERYEVRMVATGGNAPLEWDAVDLPRGLTMNRMNGRITGTPRENGTFHPVIEVTDSAGATASRTFQLEVRDNPRDPFPWDNVLPIIAQVGIALVALAVILLAGPPLVGWIGDRIDAFGNEAQASPDGGDDTGNKGGDDGTGDTTKNGDGTIDIGKLIVNNDGEYNNGLQPGEIRTVPAGYLIIGDAIVNNNPPDDKAETGQITILRKEAVVIAPSGASIVPFGPNLEQTILTQKAMMVISGCNGGCKSIDVREVR